MQTLDPKALDPAVRLAGVLDVQPTDDGVVLSRLRPEATAQIGDPVLLWTATLPSGGRIELVSDTTTIEVDLQLTRLAYRDEPAAPVAVDLVVDGELVATELTTDGHTFRLRTARPEDLEVELGGPVTARFTDLPPGEKHLQVWLPHRASVELRSIRIDDGASLAAPPQAARRWAHYGSSISHCAEADTPTGVWPVIVARRHGLDLTSLAIAGQAQLDQFAARTIRDLDVDLISLKVGINVVNGDTLRERTFVPAVHGFLDTLRDGHPTTPIVVATPIICPVAEDHPGPTLPTDEGAYRVAERPAALGEGALTLVRIRELLAQVVAARRAAGDHHLHLVDGLALFGPDDVDDLPDGLHPNSDGYARMADRFDALAFGAGGPFA